MKNDCQKDEWGTRCWFETLADQFDKKNLVSYFNHATKGYEIYRRHKVIELLRDNIDLVPGVTILDVGSAMGEMSNAVCSLYPQATVVGIDFISSLIKLASTMHRQPAFLVAALPHTPFKRQTFDLILALEVLYYLGDEDRIKAWHNLCGLLKPGGKLVFTSFLDNGKRYFSRESAINLVAGILEIERIFFDYNRVFNFFSRQLERIIRLKDSIDSNQSLDPQRISPIFRAIFMVTKIPVIGTGLRLGLAILSKAAQYCLGLEWLPRILSIISGKLSKSKNITNIAIIAHKNK